jgi:hypothetical protein
MAGDATGIIVAATVTSTLGLPMGLDAAVEYMAGFAFGLLIFQAIFMKDILGGSYWMAGMIPTMIVLMTKDARAMDPTSLRFWGVMSLATLAGATFAYPMNWWLVKNRLKHGMGTERALGKGGTKMAVERSIRVPVASPAHVAGHGPREDLAASNMAGMKSGVTLAAIYGDLSMRAGGTQGIPMLMPMPH